MILGVSRVNSISPRSSSHADISLARSHHGRDLPAIGTLAPSVAVGDPWRGSAARPRSVRAAAWSGVIVNVSSISADGGYPYTSVYQASKAAVAALTEGLHAELAEFGVVVKALHPGSMQTRIFSKVDRAQNPPEEYRGSWNNFASLNLVRSDPAVTVDVMFRMVTDGNTRKVHYYSGPDGEAIPRVKQLPGQDWYLEELGARNRGESTPLWTALMPHPR